MSKRKPSPLAPKKPKPINGFNHSKVVTPIQKWIYEFMVKTFLDEQRPPTLREIMEFAGYCGPAAALPHLEALIKKGYIARPDSKARGIKFLKTPDGQPIKGIEFIMENETT